MIDRNDIQRIATAAVAAFVIAATLALGTVGPARAAEPEQVAACPAARMLLAR